MAHIKVIQHDEAEGELLEIYNHLVKTRGALAEVHKIQSLNPATITNHMDLYMSIMFKKSPLKRYQREMMAVVVSCANKCQYCQLHHAEALQHFWKDQNKVDKLRHDFTSASLEVKDMLLCQYAQDLTLNPGERTKEKHIDPLKAVGFDDRAILDATLVIAYFNFVNRMVLGLGVHLEEQVGGYQYDGMD